MRYNKIIVLTVILLMLLPISGVIGSADIENIAITPNDFGDDVGVEAGMTIKYDITDFTVPDLLDNISVSDLSGNQLYLKILAVEDQDFGGGAAGKYVFYGLGLIFLTDETISIGEGYESVEMLIPAGSATPPIPMEGFPHFAGGDFNPMGLFFLDDGWTDHETVLESMGFTVTINAEALIAEFINGTGHLLLNWRKSDGILTDIVMNDLYFYETDMTDYEVVLALNSVETLGIELAVGDEISLQADLAFLDIVSTGDIVTMLNLSTYESYEDSVFAMEEQTVVKFVIEAIHGLYIKAEVSMYDFGTQALVSQGSYLYSAFLGSSPSTNSTLNGTDVQIGSIISPALTADYDIYTGYMLLFDSIVGVYLDDLIGFLPNLETSGISINAIDGSFQVIEKRKFFYLQNTFDINLDLDSESLNLTAKDLTPQQLSMGVGVIIKQTGWVAYHEDGYLAGIQLDLDINVEVTTDYDTYTDIPAGTIAIDLNLLLTNPEYKVPDPLGTGVIPGYTWLVSIPAILSIVVITIIRRKK
ncbi:MAG: hypothetical protein HZR80_09020 [Candidatus Heimdallarchaeota archaeon]